MRFASRNARGLGRHGGDARRVADAGGLDQFVAADALVRRLLELFERVAHGVVVAEAALADEEGLAAGPGRLFLGRERALAELRSVVRTEVAHDEPIAATEELHMTAREVDVVEVQVR